MSLPGLRIGGAERGPFAVAVVGGSLVLTGLSARAPWWAGAVVVVVALITVTVRVGGRTGARWLLDWAEFRFGLAARALDRSDPASVCDVEVTAGSCGIRTVGSMSVAMVQLAPNLDLPTIITGKTVYTEDTVSLAALLPLLDQYGLAVDIDVVTTGQRIRPTGSYSMLYDQLVGPHPVLGSRLTWLVLRLDQRRNLAALRRRGPVEQVAPRALATAAHRIAARLREQGLAAHALPAAAMREATRLLHAGVELTDLRERWDHLDTSVPGRCVTSFLIDWTQLDDGGLDNCWTWNRGRTTVVVSLAGGALGPRALVRYVGPAMSHDLPNYLRRLGGHQSAALSASLPAGHVVHTLPADERGADIAAPETVGELAITVGPNGQILGAISGQPQHALALPLFDPTRYNPRRRTVDVRARLPVAQQIVLRAIAVGADVEVHSARPERWRGLLAAIGEPGSLRLSSGVGVGAANPVEEPGVAPATIAVFDRLPPRSSAAPTTVTISEPGSARHGPADLVINQVNATSVDVRIPMRTVRVNLIEPRGEARYLDDENAASAVGPPGPSGLPGGDRRVS